MKISNKLLLLAPVVLGLGCSQATPLDQADTSRHQEQTATPPHVILIMCDDLGWGDVGFNNPDTPILTPHLDELAAAGLILTRFYSQSPVCSPTRGSALTGRHPYRYGITFANRGRLESREHTLAELYQQHGYATGHFGKWHLGALSLDVRDGNRGGTPRAQDAFAPPWEHGFDVCFSTESKVPTWNPMQRPASFQRGNFPSLGQGWNPEDVLENSQHYGTYYWDEDGQQVTDNLQGDDSRVIMDRAIPFIENAVENDQPFFAVIWFHTPHLPVVAGPEHLALYPDAPDAYHRAYYACITAMDEQVGRLQETLETLDIDDNTLIFFTSDNGPEGNASSPGSAGPFRGRKRSLYEGGVRVPSFAVWPDQLSAGEQRSVAMSTSDYAPTLASLLNAAMQVPDESVDGQNILPLLLDETLNRHTPIGFETPGTVAWHDGPWKLVGHLQQQNQQATAWELYHLTQDPAETTNLADQHPQRVETMQQALQTWRQSHRRSRAQIDTQ